jgi:hypothetical protein
MNVGRCLESEGETERGRVVVGGSGERISWISNSDELPKKYGQTDVSRWEFDTAFNQLGLPARFEASNICFK